MVLSQRHPHAHAASLQQAISRIEPVRILGIAGAIALNVTALMLLMVPVSTPIQTAPEEEIYRYEPTEKVVPPPPPIEVPVVHPTTTHTAIPTPIHPPVPLPTLQQDVIVPEGTDYTPPTNTDVKPDLGPTVPTNPDPLPNTPPHQRRRIRAKHCLAESRAPWC
jgi:periplasmic protein TonB